MYISMLHHYDIAIESLNLSFVRYNKTHLLRFEEYKYKRNSFQTHSSQSFNLSFGDRQPRVLGVTS